MLAGMFGGFGMLVSLKIQGTDFWVYAIPIASAALFSWLLSRVTPIWVPALVVGGFGLLAAFRARDTQMRWDAESAARQLDYAMQQVCDGKALNHAPNGPVFRQFHRRDEGTYWSGDYDWPDNKVPTFTVCATFSTEDVQCGDYVETGRESAGTTRVCNARQIEKIELRRTQSAEVVFTKTYRGSDPPALTGNLQFGGYNSSKLTGDAPSSEVIEKDLAPYFAQH
jgi:hypothetical protein